jgi:excisionase family DNA binding protein
MNRSQNDGAVIPLQRRPPTAPVPADVAEDAGKPIRCFCGAIINSDVEGHRTEGERKWISAGNVSENRCECLPCAQHTLEEHLEAEAESYRCEQEEQQRDQRLAGVIRRELARMLSGGVPVRVLIGIDEAARILGITSGALRKRVERHEVPGVVRTGRRVQFHRERLLAAIEKKVRT